MDNNVIYSVKEEPTNQTTRESFMRYVRKWPWFLAFSFLGIAAGFIMFKLSPGIYQVESKILIKSENNPLQSNIMLDNFLGKTASSNMSNQIEILQSYTNYRRAVENLNWQTTWYKPDKPFDKELYKSEPFEVAIPLDAKNLYNTDLYVKVLNENEFTVSAKGKTMEDGIEKSYDFESKGQFGQPFTNEFFHFILYQKNKVNKGEFYFHFNNLNRMAQNYLEKVEVEIPNINSEVIKMQVTGHIPRKEADFLNELNNVFITLGVEEEERSSEHSVNFINEQLVKIKDSLNQAEQTFSDYRQRNKIMDLSQEANFIYQKLEEVETEKYEANMKLDYYQNLRNYLDDSDRIKQISSPSVAGIDDDNLSLMLQKLTELYNRREVLSYSVKEKSPSYILLEKEINLIKNSLSENLNNLINNTKTEIAGINSRFNRIQQRLQQLPKTEKDLIGIQRNFELNNNMYNYMLKKKAEAELSQASTAPKVQIIDKALPEASTQIGPSLVMNVALGLGMGLFLPFLVIFFNDVFNSKVRFKEEVENATDITILDGIIQSGSKGKLPVIENSKSGLSESFRGLRFNLKNLINTDEHNVISINSMMPGEGKTFISSNLAAILSMTNKKVLLVGADIRKPKLEEIVDMKPDKGLSSFLNGETGFSDIINQTKVKNLYFVSAGKIPENPTELLENGKMGSFIQSAKEKFDFVVLDNAPFSLVSDGMITSKMSDLSLFTVRINKTNKRNIKDINKIVDLNNLGNVAIVLNGTIHNGFSKSYVKKGYGNYVNA